MDLALYELISCLILSPFRVSNTLLLSYSRPDLEEKMDQPFKTITEIDDSTMDISDNTTTTTTTTHKDDEGYILSPVSSNNDHMFLYRHNYLQNKFYNNKINDKSSSRKI